MAASKFQSFIKKLSESENVKKVVGDIQTISEDLQKRVQHLSKQDAVKKYKEIMKKVAQTETNLEKEVNKVIVKIKKSATLVEKNINQYKKQAVQQKAALEKILKGEKSSPSRSAAPKKATAKRTMKRKVARKTSAAKS